MCCNTPGPPHPPVRANTLNKKTVAQDGDTADPFMPFCPFGQHPALPSFPVDRFPGWAQDWVCGASEAYQVPVDVPGVMAIGALSAVSAGKSLVRIQDGWQEPVHLYLGLGLPSGAGKSPVFRAATAFLHRAEEKARAEHLARKGHRSARARVLADRARTLAAALKRQGSDTNLQAELASVMEEQHALEAERARRYVVADITAPKVAMTLQHSNPLVWASSEGELFHSISGTTGGPRDITFLLNAYDSEAIRVDRVSRDHVIVPSPYLTVLMAFQPEVLQDCMRPELRLEERGLIPRFLLALPSWSPQPRSVSASGIPPNVQQAYDAGMGQLLRYGMTADGLSPPVLLELSEDARANWEAVADKMDSDSVLGGSKCHMRPWVTKHRTRLVRIAALLHFASLRELSADVPISIDTMFGAVQIGLWFEAHAIAAYEQLRGSHSPRLAEALCGAMPRIASDLGPRMALTEIYKRTRSIMPNAEGLRSALEELIQRGYLRRLPRERAHRGRPTEWYVMSPAAMRAAGLDIKNDGIPF